MVGEYGQRPLYRMLGYFSIIGLLRVHVHLGDFTLALKVMDNVELNQKVRSELIIMISYLINNLIVSLYTCNGLPRRHLLLCWILLYHAETLPRCHPHVRYDSKLHHANAAVSYQELPI